MRIDIEFRVGRSDALAVTRHEGPRTFDNLDNVGLNKASEQIFFHLLNLEKSGTTQHVFVRKSIRTIRINLLEFAPFFICIKDT